MKDLRYYLGLNYRKVVSQDEDGIYIVEVPNLPGCTADRDTVAEAFVEIGHAMEAWIGSRIEAGVSIPEPRAGSDYSGKFLVRVPKRLHQRLAEQAEADGISLNQYVVALLSEGAGREMEKKKTA